MQLYQSNETVIKFENVFVDFNWLRQTDDCPLVPAKNFRRTSCTCSDVLSGFIAGILICIKVFLVSRIGIQISKLLRKKNKKIKNKFCVDISAFHHLLPYRKRCREASIGSSNDARHADSGETERRKKEDTAYQGKRRFTSCVTTYISRRRKLMQRDYY